MNKTKRKILNAKDKVVGEVKEVVGSVTGNEELELKLKVQSIKSDIRTKTDLGDKADEIKENIAEKINDILEKKHDDK